MECNNNKSSIKQQSDKTHYQKVLKEIKLIHRRSNILKFHQDTENLDVEER